MGGGEAKFSRFLNNVNNVFFIKSNFGLSKNLLIFTLFTDSFTVFRIE